MTTGSGQTRSVNAAACSVLNGRPVAVTSNDNIVRVWDVVTGKKITTFSGHTSLVRAVACSVLEGRPIAVTTSYDGTGRVWDLATADEISTLFEHTISASAVACSVLDGHPVAISAGAEYNTSFASSRITRPTPVRIWDLAPHTEASAVASRASSSNPSAVPVRVWGLTTADEVDVFDLRDASCAAVGPSGELVVAMGWDLVVLDRTAKV